MTASHLLSDAQVQSFVVNGFIQVQTELDPSVHETAHRRTAKAFAPIHDMQTDGKYNPQNNILPMVPELHQVLSDPNVVGALTSIFGNNYLIHPHRHCHPNFPVAKAGPRTTIMGIHKDGHADGNPKPRHRVPRWGLLFYNPHPCPEELGPTCITPGSHYYHRIITKGEREPHVPVIPVNGRFTLPENYVGRSFVPVVSELGTVSILHFDMVHSVITNIGDMDRYAHKFVIMRTEEPEAPSWNSTGAGFDLEPPEGIAEHRGLWEFIWDWLCGKSGDARGHARSGDGPAREAAPEAYAELVAVLNGPDDGARLDAAYALRSIGEPAVGPLLEMMATENAFFAEQPIVNVSEAAHALIAVGRAAVEPLIDSLRRKEGHVRAWAAFALGEIGRPARSAIPAIIAATADPSPEVCKHSISALGILGRGDHDAEQRLREILTTEEDSDQRVYAIQGLIRLNAGSRATVAALHAALSDPQPYVAAFAAELLYRVGDPSDQRGLLEFLRPLRWFPYRNA